MYMPLAVVWEPDRLPGAACVAEALYRTMVVAAQTAKSSHRAATAAMIGRSQVVVPLPPAAAAALSLAIHSIVADTWKIVNDKQWRLLSNATARDSGQLPAKVGNAKTLTACVPPVRALYCALRHMSDPSVAAKANGNFSQRLADWASVLYCARLSRNAKSVGPLTMPVWNAIRAVATVSGKSDTAEITRYAAWSATHDRIHMDGQAGLDV